MATGPLNGIRVLEFAGLGPGPFAAMLLSDMGAEVLTIDRRGAGRDAADVTARGRKSLILDLKSPAAVEACMALIEQSHVLIEGFRPGVMERLGLGPDQALARNRRLVYGRMTGWGQTGPLAHAAGHDINYIAVTGALAAIGAPDRPPPPPLNLVGDFGGGSLYLAMGVLAALIEAGNSGAGQVVDAAIVDGTTSLLAMAYGLHAREPTARGEGLLDGGAPFYRCYECADGKYVSVGPLEPHFYATLLSILEIDGPEITSQAQADWPANAEQVAAVFRTLTRDEWCARLEGTDACFAPVLDLDEARRHPQVAALGAVIDVAGVAQPAPAPRFSRTPGAVQGPPPAPDEGGLERAIAWGAPADVLRAARS